MRLNFRLLFQRKNDPQSMVVLQLLILLKLFTDCHLVQISFITRFPSQLLHVLIEIDVPSKLLQMDIFLAVAQN